MESNKPTNRGAHGKTLVVGLGEVGGALAAVLDRKETVLRHDVEPVDIRDEVEVMHFCIPFQSPEQFENIAVSYIRRFNPKLTIVNSTVLPGTTRSLANKTRAALAYSPVRGKHIRMQEDLLRYTKFVAATTDEAVRRAQAHFESAGMKTRRMGTVESLEIAKLAETSYFGICIAFAQELNRYTERLGGNFDDAIGFFEEVDFLPRVRYFPGFIGGHCVVPNLNLLLQIAPSALFEAVLDSNERRAHELASEGSANPQTDPPTGKSNEAKVLADR